MNNVVENVKTETTRTTKIQVYVTEAEYEAFKEALKRSGRYHSMSDALRDFIRDFVDAQGVTPRSVVGVRKEKEAEVQR
jgi:Arc/MetJ-type ribon-helix-helix transcriptional regulator